MFEIDAWGTILKTLKPLYKCHKNDVIQEAEKTVERLKRLKLDLSENLEIQKYADRFILDSLLAAKNYKEYILLSREMDQGIPTRGFACKRLELSFRENIPIDPVDVLALPYFTKEALIIENFDLFKEHFINIFNSKFATNEDVLAFLCRRKKVRYNQFFVGLFFSDEPRLINKRINIFLLQEHCFLEEKEALEDIKKILIREAENRLRESFRLPHVGQGWVQETRLFNLIREEFLETKVIQHGSPSWLGRQHLDIWIPEYSIAVEYHGRQHFEPVEFFGGQEAFEKSVLRDKRKENLCIENKVHLVIVREKQSFEAVVAELRELVKRTQL